VGIIQEELKKMKPAKTLSSEAAQRFAELKKIVTSGLPVCLMVGEALAEIKANKYYEAEGFSTFTEFCEKEWEWSRRYCNQLIVNADVMRKLPEDVRALVKSEKAARALAQVPEMLRAEVLKTAAKRNGGNASADAIKDATPEVDPEPPEGADEPADQEQPAARKAPARQVKTKGGPPPRKPKKLDEPKDGTGLIVPEEIRPMWERRHEADEVLALLASVRTRMLAAHRSDDPLWFGFNHSSSFALSNQLYANLREVEPFAVCPACGGGPDMMPEKSAACGTCKGRGFVSEFFWNTCVPEEARALRVKAVEQQNK
jgi:hypothetical protein